MIRDRLSAVGRGARLACLPVLVCVQILALTVSGEDLIPRLNDGNLQVAAPRLHFISGRQLERLRNGASIPFDFQLTLSSSSKGDALGRALERFVVSYDLWEEKFFVIRQRDRRTSGVRLSATQAESWCLDHVALPFAGLAPAANFWLRLDVRSAENRDQVAAAGDGISLTTLVEIFSRPVRGAQEHWALESGPFRLADLKR